MSDLREAYDNLKYRIKHITATKKSTAHKSKQKTIPASKGRVSRHPQK